MLPGRIGAPRAPPSIKSAESIETGKRPGTLYPQPLYSSSSVVLPLLSNGPHASVWLGVGGYNGVAGEVLEVVAAQAEEEEEDDDDEDDEEEARDGRSSPLGCNISRTASA